MCVSVCVCVCLWQPRFECTGCGDTCTLYTSATGAISDGSGPFYNYENDALCLWLIGPTGATRITITFREFHTELDYDEVAVVACADSNCETAQALGLLSGQYYSQQTFSTTLPYIAVIFQSDDSVTKSGWTATWSATVSFDYISMFVHP